MKLSFNLKQPNCANDTVIFCNISYNNQRVKVYTDKSINPKFWNKDEYRARGVASFPQHPEFNQRLKDIGNDIEAIF